MRPGLKDKLKPWMLPIAMVMGMVFHNYMEALEFLAPWLIFVMLLVTFCRITPRELRVTRLSWMLLSVQVPGALALFLLLREFDYEVACAAFICVFCPTATAAPVITGMLGGSISRLVTYSIVSNVAVAVLSPPLFAWIGGAEISMTESILKIASKVVPLIILPLLVAFMLLWKAPKLHHTLASHQSLSFYIWAVSLVLVVGRSVSFAMHEPSTEVLKMCAIALMAGVVCVAQFIVGRRCGRRCGDCVAGGQGLGQKNTVLAIWMALTYLNPIVSIGPAAYVAWQNTINSVQLYVHGRKQQQQAEIVNSAEND